MDGGAGIHGPGGAKDEVASIFSLRYDSILDCSHTPSLRIAVYIYLLFVMIHPYSPSHAKTGNVGVESPAWRQIPPMLQRYHVDVWLILFDIIKEGRQEYLIQLN